MHSISNNTINNSKYKKKPKMKKPFKNTLFANSFHGILALVLVCLASSCTSLQSGQSFIGEYGGITYRYEVIVSYHNYVRVTPVSGPEAVVGAITLPSTVRYNEQNYVVSQIGANAFCGYNGITSVNIPATVSVIESAAFRNCQSMTTVDMPSRTAPSYSPFIFPTHSRPWDRAVLAAAPHWKISHYPQPSRPSLKMPSTAVLPLPVCSFLPPFCR